MADDRAAQLREYASTLLAAERSRRPLAGRRDELGLDEAEAYLVQEMRLELAGGKWVGYKLGFTSAAMREQMAVPEPNFGVLTESMGLAEGRLATKELLHPRIEPEIAVRTSRELSGAVTPEEVRDAIAEVMGAFEVVDSRFRDYRFYPLENTADNSSAARYLLGTPASPANVDLVSLPVVMEVNGREVGRGLGGDALGGPVEALSWLLGALAARGRSLPAGSIVLTGGLTRAHPVSPGDRFVATFGPLGRVELACE